MSNVPFQDGHGHDILNYRWLIKLIKKEPYVFSPDRNQRPHYGSLHKCPETNPPALIPPWALLAEHWSEAVVIEADAMTFLPFFKALDDDLRKIVPRDVWDSLITIWPTVGPVSPLNDCRLWAVALTVGMFCMRTAPGMEDFLRDAARQQGKSFGFLETASTFAARADAIPPDDLLLLIRKVLDDKDAVQRNVQEMFVNWSARDLDGLYRQALQAPIFAIETVRQAVLVARNRAWVPVIKDLLQSPKRTLIAVGAMHLCAPGNLLDCLGLPYETIA